MSYKKLLVTCDLTTTGRVTVKKANRLAKVFGAEVSLVHVVEPMPGYASGYLGVVDLERELFEEARKGIEELGKSLNIPATNLYVEVGSPKLVILKVAEELGTDLIIMGSHGRHGISLLMGSTVGAVLHGARCDVLTIYHTEEHVASA